MKMESAQDQYQQAESMEQVMPRVEQEQLLLEWDAPTRPFKKHDREYFTTIAVIVLLLSVILFFAGQFLPIAVVVSAAFLSYVMAAIPPQDTHHQITTYGIRTLGKLYTWGELGRFWFTARWKQDVLNIEHYGSFPARLVLLLGDQEKDQMQSFMSEFLINQTPLPTFIDKATIWLQEKIPLEHTDKA